MPNLLRPLPVESALPIANPSINGSVLSGDIDGTLSWTDRNTLLYQPISNVIYVTKSGSDLNTGKSIAFAKASIRAALASASEGSTVIVSSGEYTEQTPLSCPAGVTVTANGNSVRIKPLVPASDVFYLNSGSVIEGITVVDHQDPSIAFSILSGSVILNPPVLKNCKVVSTISSGFGIVVNGSEFTDRSNAMSMIIEQCDITASNNIGVLSKNGAVAHVINCCTWFCDVGFKGEAGGKLFLQSCSCFYGNYGISSIGFSSTVIDEGTVIQNEKASVSSITIEPNTYLASPLPVITIDAPFDVGIVPVEWEPNTEVVVGELDEVYVVNEYNDVYQVVTGGTTGPTAPVHTRGTETNGTCLLTYIGTPATASLIIQGDYVIGIELTNTGGGYSSIPNVYFDDIVINADVEMSYIGRVYVEGLVQQIIPNNLIEINGEKYPISFVTKLDATTSDITFISNLLSVNTNDSVAFYSSSEVTALGHQFNYVGSGTDSSALLKNNGYSIPEFNIVRSNFGSIHYTGADVHSGVTKIGDIFEVNQITGVVTATPLATSLSNVSSIGPFLRNGSTVGVPLKEVSANNALISSNGAADPFTVPTQTAIINYLQSNYISTQGGSIVGQLAIGDVVIEDNAITTAQVDQDLVISPKGNIDVDSSTIINLAQPINDNDAATKKFVVDLVQGGVTVPSVIPIIWGSNEPAGSLTLRSTKSANKPIAGVVLDDNIPSTSVTTGTLVVNGGVGINGTLNAITKSFNIEHPLDSTKRLCYGSLESPYHGVRLTGQGIVQNGSCVVELPSYICKLVESGGVNIQLTNIGHSKVLWVGRVDIAQNKFLVNSDCVLNNYQFYWTFTAIRNDVESLVVEQDA